MKKTSRIIPLYDPVTWYIITHAGRQVAQSVGLPKQNNSSQSTLTCLRFGSLTVQLASRHV